MDEWNDPTRPPVEAATDHGSNVWSTMAWTWDAVPRLLLWHFCDHNLWLLKEGRDPALVGPSRWAPGGVGAHQLVSEKPLHLEPSVYWSDCCGMHGWVRNGLWTSA